MRVIGLFLVIGILVSPLILLQTLVMPELMNLQLTYSHLDEVASRAVNQ